MSVGDTPSLRITPSGRSRRYSAKRSSACRCRARDEGRNETAEPDGKREAKSRIAVLQGGSHGRAPVLACRTTRANTICRAAAKPAMRLAATAGSSVGHVRATCLFRGERERRRLTARGAGRDRPGGIEVRQGLKWGRARSICRTQRISTMVNHLKFYIDGAWQDPATKKTLPVVNPATEEAAVRGRAWVGRGCRQGRGGRAPRVRDLFADDARAARRAAGQDHRGLQAPHEGHRRRHLRRDGRAARASRSGSRPAPASAT